MLISLGESQRRAGDSAHRETLLEAADLARRRGDASGLARAALANTRGYLPTEVGKVDGEKVAMLEAAASAVGARDPRSRARLLATLGLELAFAGDWRHCVALSDEALILARSLDDPKTLAWVLLNRYFPASVPDLLDGRRANLAEFVEVTGTVADPALTADAYLLHGRAPWRPATWRRPGVPSTPPMRCPPISANPPCDGEWPTTRSAWRLFRAISKEPIV